MPGDRSGSTFRHFAVLGAVIVLWWVLPGAIRRVVREGFYEFQAPLFLAESRLKDIRSYWTVTSRRNDELIAAARDLARGNADLALRLAAAEGVVRENRRLAEAVGLPTRREFRQIVARVADRDINRWWSRVVLSKGSTSGVIPGCAVVNGGGVVGVVGEVHRDTCEVRLLTDPGFRISAHIDGSDALVIYGGATTSGFGRPVGRVTNVPSDFRNDTGHALRLVSSELGGKFLFGLPIGTLAADPAATPDGLFQEADVLVRRDLFDLQEATILVPVVPDNLKEGV